jgi:hypothetical protein
MSANSFSQGFVEAVEDDALSALFGNECFLKLSSGEEIHGTLSSGTFVSTGFSKITIKLDNGEKVKYASDQVLSVRIKSSDLLKLFMVTEAGSSISEMANTNFNDIINRQFVIFETALTPKKNDTKRLLQILNAGFDSRLKVFADPTAKTSGLNVGGIQLTGGEDKAYLFVKGGEKAFTVKKGSYSKNFEELFGDCPKMIEAYKNNKIKWEDVALHVFYYNQFCK